MEEDDQLIANYFIRIAKGNLDTEVFHHLYKMAIGEAKSQNIGTTAIAKRKLFEKKKITLRNKIPHATERLQERYGINQEEIDLVELATIIKLGGLNVKVNKNSANIIQDVDVRYRGMLINAIYDKSNNKLITVLPIK